MTPVLTIETIENKIIPAIKKAERATTNDVILATYIAENHADEFDVWVKGTHEFEITLVKPMPAWAKALLEVYGDDDNDDITSEHECHCGGECGGCGCHCEESEDEALAVKLVEIEARLDNLEMMLDLLSIMLGIEEFDAE